MEVLKDKYNVLFYLLFAVLVSATIYLFIKRHSNDEVVVEPPVIEKPVDNKKIDSLSNALEHLKAIVIEQGKVIRNQDRAITRLKSRRKVDNSNVKDEDLVNEINQSIDILKRLGYE